MPFDNSAFNYRKIGGSYYFTPDSAFFQVKSGLEYCYRGNNDASFNLLNIPLGIDFLIGKKLQFIFGAGLQYSYILFYDFSPIMTSNNYKINSNSQFSCKGNVGFSYQLNSKYKAKLLYQSNIDITDFYHSSMLYKGIEYTFDSKGVDGFIAFSIVYSL